MAKIKEEKPVEEFKEDSKLDVFENLVRKEKHDIEKRRKPGEVFFGTRADRRGEGRVNLQRRAANKVATEKLDEGRRKERPVDSPNLQQEDSGGVKGA